MKTKNLSKKALSVFLAVLMLMSAWILVPAGNYASAEDATEKTCNHNDPANGGVETVLVGKVDATCTTNGYSGDVYCSVCYDADDLSVGFISRGQVIKATGIHKLGDAVPEYKCVDADGDGEIDVDDEGNIVVTTADFTYEQMIAKRNEDGKWYHYQRCSQCGEIFKNACYTYEHTYSCVSYDSCELCGGLCSLKDANKHADELIKFEEVPATCIETGIKAYYRCEDCGLYFYDLAGKNLIGDEAALAAATADGGALVIAKTGHAIDWSNGTVVQAPTCGVMGKTEYKCKFEGCNETVVLENIPSDGVHNWSSAAKTVSEATCESNAYEAYYCTVCQTIKPGTYVAVPDTALGHNIPEEGMTVVKPATCTEDGIKSGTCTREGCNQEATAVIPALGHSFSEWAIDEADPGNCLVGMNEKRTCANCGATETRTVPSDDHDYEVKVTVEPTCKADGYKIYVCKRCDIEKRETLTNYGIECQYNENAWKVEKKATCQEGEMRTYSCVVCGNTKTEEYVGDGEGAALGHIWKKQLSKVPLCEKDGYTAHIKCVRCEVILGTEADTSGTPVPEGYEYQVIKALGHHDNDGDDKCDRCSAYLGPQPGKKDCDCMCHGSAFEQFLYKIVRIFWKIFKTNQECTCGDLHW
ncbi:MAG: hypothetical protein ACI4GC_00375 [Acutalibacteraceae bacterium]